MFCRSQAISSGSVVAVGALNARGAIATSSGWTWPPATGG
jgi:hypothetical protein